MVKCYDVDNDIMWSHGVSCVTCDIIVLDGVGTLRY